jgi:hypothetical protein
VEKNILYSSVIYKEASEIRARRTMSVRHPHPSLPVRLAIFPGMYRTKNRSIELPAITPNNAAIKAIALPNI